ncbi:hypothetical protein, partial [Eisenbergiella sp.]
PVEQQDSKGKSQGDCVPLYNRKGEKALKMQDETGIIPLKINLLVRAEHMAPAFTSLRAFAIINGNRSVGRRHP